MYKIQALERKNWAANAQLTFNLETLMNTLGQAPLHVSEIIIRGTFVYSNPTERYPADFLAKVFSTIEAIPNEVCEASRVDGLAAWALDWALTGRRPMQDSLNIIAAPGTGTVDVTVRLPYHACLNGMKSDKYGDLISPVRRWKNGNINVTCCDSNPDPNYGMTIESGQITVLIGTEPYPDGYHVGPMPVFDLFRRPVGDSFTWVSKGRLAFLGVNPSDGASDKYPAFDIRDACWVSSLTTKDLQMSWQAYQSLGYLGDLIGGTTANGPFIPLLWTRPCGAKLWTMPRFERGNRTVDCPGNTEGESHRVITAQLIPSGGYLNQLSENLGLRAGRPRIAISNAADRIRSSLVKDYLPRDIPFWAMNRAGQVLRRRKDR